MAWGSVRGCRMVLKNDDFETPEAYELADLREARFEYLYMSTQTAIDFLPFLINLQIKVDKFSQRAPTVG